MDVEINGIKYLEVTQPKIPKANKLFIVLTMLGDVSSIATRNEVSTAELAMEFKLIQQKKSKLSRAKRDSIERQFHLRFKPITKQL